MVLWEVFCLQPYDVGRYYRYLNYVFLFHFKKAGLYYRGMNNVSRFQICKRLVMLGDKNSVPIYLDFSLIHPEVRSFMRTEKLSPII